MSRYVHGMPFFIATIIGLILAALIILATPIPPRNLSGLTIGGFVVGIGTAPDGARSSGDVR